MQRSLSKTSNCAEKQKLNAENKQLREQPKIVYREKRGQFPEDKSDSGSRHLTKVQVTRLKRMFSELPTVPDAEINDVLNSARNTQSSVKLGLVWEKLPEGVLIAIRSTNDARVNATAERVSREMVALGIAVIINPNPSFPENSVVILVGSKPID